MNLISRRSDISSLSFFPHIPLLKLSDYGSYVGWGVGMTITNVIHDGILSDTYSCSVG
jgi:hypothetical protein